MPTTLNFNTKQCNECGIIIPFNNVVLDRQKDYSVTFTAVSSLPNCTTEVEPAIHSFVPTQTSSTLYTSLTVFGCDNRSTTFAIHVFTCMVTNILFFFRRLIFYVFGFVFF